MVEVRSRYLFACGALVLAGVLFVLLSFSGGKCKLETDGPLAIRFVGVRPDQGDDLLDGAGKRIGSFNGTLMENMSWGEDCLRRDFIFEIPESNEPVYFLPAELPQVSDGGKFINLNLGVLNWAWVRTDSSGQFVVLTAAIPRVYMKSIFGYFHRWRQTEKIDIRLHYNVSDVDGALKGPYEVKVRNVLVNYRDRPVRDHAEYLDVMAERLELTDRPVKELLWYRFRNWKEALKVVDVVRGRTHVKAVMKHLTNLTRDELDNLGEDSLQRIRKAAMSWLENSSLFEYGIAVGLACGWDEFFDMAPEELSRKVRVFSSTSTTSDVISDMVHKSAIAEVLRKYPVAMNVSRVSKLKEIIRQTDNEGVRSYLIDCLGASESVAAADGLWELAQDKHCWIWWPATAIWYERNGCEGNSCDELPIKMKVRLMLVKDAAFDEQLEAPLRRLAGEVLTPAMLKKSGNLACDVLEQVTQRLDKETVMMIYENLLVELEANLGQNTPRAEIFYVCYSGKVVSKIARHINVWYGGNIGGLGREATAESTKLEPRKIDGVTNLISEVLKWYESNKDAEPVEQERI